MLYTGNQEPADAALAQVTTHTILHTIETGGPGGAETILLCLASRLDPARFRSLALVPDGHWLPGKLRELDVPTFLFYPRQGFNFASISALVRLVRRESVDLIHSHLPDQNFYSCVAGRLTGRPTVTTYHGRLEGSARGGWRRTLKLGFVRRSAKVVVAVSDHLQRALQQYGLPAQRLARIYNGVNAERFASAPRGRLRAELGCNSATPLVGMVANLRASKGYEYFVHAARRVADSFPQAHFVAVGELEPSLGKPLRDLVRALRLGDRWHFLGFREDIPDILRDLDVFVLSSTSEGFSLATLEAMAAGRPVVVTRSGGPQEIVEDARTGALVPPADAEQLAARVCELLTHPQQAAEMGERARTEVLRRFSLDQMVRDYQSLYEKCLRSN